MGIETDNQGEESSFEESNIRLTIEHTFLINALPRETVPDDYDIRENDKKDSEELNDYLIKRFSPREEKITFTSKLVIGSVLERIPNYQWTNASVIATFRHVEPVNVTARDMRESVIKVSDNIASNKSYDTVLISVSDLERLVEESCKILEKEGQRENIYGRATKERIENEVLGFKCMSPKDAYEYLKENDPMFKNIERLLSEST